MKENKFDTVKNAGNKNSIEEDIKNAEHFIKTIKTDIKYVEENCWHVYYDKEIVELARILQNILSDYKRVLKENEELKQDRNNNYQMIALAQNEALGYMQGYEDGKKLKRSAVANIVENQQYYIFNKQIEHYKENIVKLQKENEKALAEYMEWQKQELEQKNKIIDLMAEDIDGFQMECNRYFKDKEEVKQYFENKAKEIK